MKLEDTTTASIPNTPSLMPSSDGQAFGNHYFDCDFTYTKQLGKGKHKHWKTFLQDAELTDRIKRFRKENPKTKIMLRDIKTNSFVMANAGLF